MADLDPRWHLRSEPGSSKTRCGLNFEACTVNDVDVWMEHVHPASCTLCMLALDRSQKQYTRAGDAIKEAVVPQAPPPLLAPPSPAVEETHASNIPAAASPDDVIIPDAPDPEPELERGRSKKKR